MSEANEPHNPSPQNSGSTHSAALATHFENIRQIIPDMETAVADYNGVPFNSPPFRDTPSAILGNLFRPDLSRPEPNWNTLLHYFLTPAAKHGFANLQDLFLFIVRVVVPNAIIQNRRMMIEYFSTFPHASSTIQVRSDMWDNTQQAQMGIQNIQVTAPLPSATDPRPNLPLNYSTQILDRSIFRNRMTPNGAQFLEWLVTSVGPGQATHRPGEIDQYLGIAESTIRGWTMEDLMRHTIRALSIFWWVNQCNDRFQKGHTTL
jgi:hypothetical protein